ncbi:MAG: DUF1361 domain-containing protein [Chloroflexota bacterium]|nr:MAG: DUF1361 domain-containing protein [Chloroflexota bacterium]
MLKREPRLLVMHRFLQNQMFYPVVLSSLLCIAFFAMRALWSDSFLHKSLMWNLFLAWIPYFCALGMAWLHARRAAAWQYILPSLVWLLFFPNAAYLVTDLYKLRNMPPVPIWYDVGFFAMMAWTGLLLAVASLQIVQRMVKQSASALWSWLVVFVVIGLNGVGIYLGRFLRWNSWDVMTDPIAVLQDAIAPFLNPIAYRQSVAIMIVFSALLFVVYVSVVTLQRGTRDHDGT